MKTLSFWKKSVYSALVFFGTVVVLSIGYSLVGNLSVADKVGTGSGLTVASWNKIVDGILDLDTRLSNITFSGNNVGIGVTPSAKLEVNGDIDYHVTGTTNRVHNLGGESGVGAPSVSLPGSVSATTTLAQNTWTSVQAITVPTPGTYLIISNYRIRHDTSQGTQYAVLANLTWNDGSARTAENRLIFENIGSISNNYVNYGGSVSWVINIQASNTSVSANYLTLNSPSTWWNDTNGIPRLIAVRLY